jgi:hypothetical protein
MIIVGLLMALFPAPNGELFRTIVMAKIFFQSIIRVARWFVFKPKIPIWVNTGGSSYGKSWYIL